MVADTDKKLPDWAEKYNFKWHSPSGAVRPDCAEFFDKVIARPNDIKSPAGCQLLAGTAAHEYAELVLVDGETEGEAMSHAMSILDEHKVLEYFPADNEKFDIIKNGTYKSDVTDQEDNVFQLTLQHLLQGTKEATRGENKLEAGTKCLVEMDGLELPYLGFMDIMTRSVVELKTKWPYIDSSGKSKRGFKINSLPAKPDSSHVQQCALYWKWMREQAEGVKVYLVYANCKNYRVFSSDDCEELSEPRLNMALDQLRKLARHRENLMKRSATVPDLMELVLPDFSHWWWKDKSPEFKSAAEMAFNVGN